MRVVIAAAGTGGHINPGIAIANKIKEMEPGTEVLFIGTDRGLENDLVPRAGYELQKLNAYGFSKEISITNLKKIISTIKSIKVAKKILEKFKPDVIIGTGGYICFPVCMAAKKLGLPVILHESNAFPGKAVKILSKKADKILVGFEDAKKRLPYPEKVVVTGTPTKIRKVKYSENEMKILKQKEELDETLPIVLIFGGSQGAIAINKSILDILKNKKNEKFQIVWAVGKDGYDDIIKELKKGNIEIKNAKILPYIYNMQEMLNICDLVIARSGAMTITEVSIVRKTSYINSTPKCFTKSPRI